MLRGKRVVDVVPSPARPACRRQGSGFHAKAEKKADPSGKKRLRDDNLDVFPQIVIRCVYELLRSRFPTEPTREGKINPFWHAWPVWATGRNP